MSVGAEHRPLLPNQRSMSNFSFAPPNMGVPNDKKNYVFVDEHNRHRRLKVVRACEGCRRRKIKCDSATTNQWPCAACIRLKLQCVPPAVSYELPGLHGDSKLGMQGVLDFDNSSGSGDEDYAPQYDNPLGWDAQGAPHQVQAPPQLYNNMGAYGTPPYTAPMHQQDFSYNDIATMPLSASHSSFSDASSYTIQANQPLPRDDKDWIRDQFTGADLSDILGELKINENGVAPYISQQKRTLAEAPAYEEVEARLPKTMPQSGNTVRIPPELMPSDEQCLIYFDIYFTNIHQYVPVVSKPYFYSQWRTNRRSISPLILEAIFACAGRMSEDAAQGAQWLALAGSHEECFMDVPRLSTVQAMMILIKARESAPKRGYYYRSWMTIKKIVTMAHDLDLHEHYEQHKAGILCNSDPTECLVKTRIWQTLFVLEVMVGAPQGRTDMGIAPETVDLNVQRPSPGIQGADYQISRQFTYLVRKIFNVRQMHDLKGKVKEAPTKNWVNDPKFINLGSILSKWLDDLPRDLQVTFSDDDTPPWLSSHFVGNMHSYFHLTRVMLHRPQLMHSSSYADGSWKRHMAICYDSSKKMCRLQEGILKTFTIDGLLCMQRGINFVIYAVLTCTMVHLVAITSPDPEFNQDAKDYFTRHMRILETCTTAWPQPDMQKQIDALREAFSADTSRPFELKSTFPYGSPNVRALQPSPPLDSKYQLSLLQRAHSQGNIAPQMPFQSGPMTPPMTAGVDGPRDGSMVPTSGNILSNGQQTSMADAWNPTPIFEGWNAAFGEHSASMAEVSASLPQKSPPLFTATSMGLSPISLPITNQQSYPMTTNMPPISRTPSTRIAANTNGEPSFVTSNMWRESIANTYDRGALKRGWDQQSSFLVDPVQSKRSR